MTRVMTCCVLCLLASAGVASGEGPSVTVRPSGSGVGVAAEGSPVPCTELIRYDDGSDDFPGSGRTLGGSNNESQGILATPPATAPSWTVQSAGFYVDFWVSAGTINVMILDRANPTNTTTESVLVDGPGIYEVEFSSSVCVPGDFDVLLCPEPGAHGVTGEDTAEVDPRSFHQSQVCANLIPANSLDLMIWTCVTPCAPVPVERKSWGVVKGAYR